MITVESWGIAGSVLGGGHAGRAWLGQSRGGALDRAALALANRLVGNAEDGAGVETSGGLVLALHQAAMVAITGALADVVVSGGPAVGWGSPVVLPAGSRLRIGRLLDGARCYVAVRGGVHGAGDELIVGPDPAVPAATEGAPRRPLQTTLRVWPGPRRDWFTASAWSTLLSTPFTVTTTSRVGVRLAGAPLVPLRHQQLPSEGLLEGAVQVPPDGHPILMLADHPTTGGYPVIAVIDDADVGHAAQAPLGSTLRFAAAR